MEAEQDEYSFMKELLISWAARDGEERGKVEEWGALLPATFAELREMGQNEWNAMMERVSGMGEEKLAEKLGALQMDGMRVRWKNGGDVSASRNYSALHLACGWVDEYPEAAVQVLEWSKDVNQQEDKYGWTALTVAAMCAKTDAGLGVVKRLVEVADLEVKSNDGWTALMHGAYNGRMEVAQVLIEAGAQVEVKDNGGSTALMYGAMNGHVEVVQMLIGAGADLDAKNNDGITALILVANNGHVEVVQMLIEAGAELDAKNNAGWTAVLYGACNGHVEVVQMLILAGAELGVKNNIGWTAVLYGARYGRVEVVQMLIEAGAELEVSDNAGWTALVHGARYGHAEVVQVLIGAGAELGVKMNAGRTALLCGARNGHVEVVQILIEAGAQLDAKDNNGWTALMHGASNRHVEVVQMLIEAGAQLEVKSNDGTTVLDLARSQEVADLLLAAGCSVFRDPASRRASAKEYPLVHLRAVRDRVEEELGEMVEDRESEKVRKRMVEEAPPILERTFNLHVVPYVRLLDGIYLYCHGEYAASHPMREKVEKVDGIYEDGIAEVEKEEVEEVVGEIRGLLRKIAEELYRRDCTVEGRERLRKIALMSGAVEGE